MGVVQGLRRFIPQPLVAMVVLPAIALLIERAFFDPSPNLSLGAFKWTGAALVVAGVAVEAWCGVTFVRFGQTWDYFDTPARLVTDGPYRISRHPVYLGGVLINAGLALLFQSVGLFLYLGLYILILDRLVIPRIEEPVLLRNFGEAYVRYRGTVRRWL